MNETVQEPGGLECMKTRDEDHWTNNVRLKPFDHQLVGTQAVIDKPVFALFDDMGIGKTKQVIDAAQQLFLDGKIHQVIIICPGSVRSVWYEEEFGELKKHLWDGVPSRVVHYHQRTNFWSWCVEDKTAPYLRWVITNYEFIRKQDRLYGVLDFCDMKTLLVLDESSCVKGFRAKQTLACMKIREHCGRIVLLNGTPIAHSPHDMFSQGRLMDPKILDCKSNDVFTSRYTRKEWDRRGKSHIKWVNLDDLQDRFHPYVLRRLKSECLDLPEKMDPVTLTCQLDERTWEIYQKLKNEFIVWLDTEPGTVLKAQQAIVKALRLAQLCGGFLGGLEHHQGQDTLPAFLGGSSDGNAVPLNLKTTQEVGREKLDVVMEWTEIQRQQDENLKLLIWCRFRAELDRLVKEFRDRYPDTIIESIQGGQGEDERDRAKFALLPDTAPEGPVIVVGSPQAGGMGLNLAAAHTVLYYSNDHNMKTRVQSEDRTHRPGQLADVSYFDVMAVGPNGQRTMDHTVINSIHQKIGLANMTTEKWREILSE